MKSIRVEFRLIVTNRDGSEYGGKIVYRRGTAAQRLLDYQKDGLPARVEVWSNETGEWTHLASQDFRNELAAVTPSAEQMKNLDSKLQEVAAEEWAKHPNNPRNRTEQVMKDILAGKGPLTEAELDAAATELKRLGFAKNARIITPRGKKLSVKQYLSLVSAQQHKSIASECQYAHFECAAWFKGPCSAELAGPEEE